MSRIKSYQQFYEQKVAGGLSAGMSIEDIAKHHGVKIGELKPEYDKGIEVEMEHTKDPEIAAEIARDHLYEDPKYYTKLATIEEGFGSRLLDTIYTDYPAYMKDIKNLLRYIERDKHIHPSMSREVLSQIILTKF